MAKKDKHIKAMDTLLKGGIYKPEEYKEEPEEDEANAVKIVFATSGTYPDGTPWERKPTSEEAALYEDWMK